jgi:SH3-like domain-containing protein
MIVKQMKTIGWILFFLLLASAAIAWADRLAVSVSVANIRSGPGEKYDILWSVEKYHPLDVFQKSGQWYHFRDFEKDEGWIHESLVSKILSVITRKENCSIRSGPGPRFAILFTVEKGIPFKVLNRKNGWIHVQHADGDSGWIHESLVW